MRKEWRQHADTRQAAPLLRANNARRRRLSFSRRDLHDRSRRFGTTLFHESESLTYPIQLQKPPLSASFGHNSSGNDRAPDAILGKPASLGTLSQAILLSKVAGY